MLNSLLQLDESVFFFINGFNSHSGDILMDFLSRKLVWLPLYFFLTTLIIYNFRKKSWIILLVIGVCIGLSDMTGSKLFKPNIKRLRPSHNKKLEKDIHLLLKKDGTYYQGGTYGYFSSHASTTFCLASFLILIFRRKHKSILLLVLWSVSIGYSRIYLGVHYPLDVITGFICGFLYAFMGFKILKHLGIVKES